MTRGKTDHATNPPATKKRSMRRTTHPMPSHVVSPAPPVSATEIETSMMARTSSTSAVASMALPSLVRRTPSSSRVWAEMLVEFADITTPVRSATCVGNPKAQVSSAMTPSGTAAPRMPA
jgi:hypothetical protein